MTVCCPVTTWNRARKSGKTFEGAAVSVHAALSRPSLSPVAAASVSQSGNEERAVPFFLLLQFSRHIRRLERRLLSFSDNE